MSYDLPLTVLVSVSLMPVIYCSFSGLLVSLMPVTYCSSPFVYMMQPTQTKPC